MDALVAQPGRAPPTRDGSRPSSPPPNANRLRRCLPVKCFWHPIPTDSTAQETAITCPVAPRRNGHGEPGATAGLATTPKYSRPVPPQRSTDGRPSTRSVASTNRSFCYFEDVDLGFRLRLGGHNCVYVHSAIVEHVSSALSGYRSDFAVYHGERNAVWTFFKNMPSALLWLYLPQHLLLNLAALIYYPWRGQGRVVIRAKFDACRALATFSREGRSFNDRGGRVHGQ